MSRRTYEISPETSYLIDVLALKHGIPKSRVIEESVRLYADRSSLPLHILEGIERMIDSFRRLPRY